MAKYCFYCGRELGDHEKCDCRSRAYVSGEGRNASPPPPPEKAEAGGAAGAGSGSDKRSTDSSNNWKHREDDPSPRGRAKRVKKSRPAYGRSPQNRAQLLQSFLHFFSAPADAMAGDRSIRWTRSHTIWFSTCIALSGFLYSLANRYLTQVSGGVSTRNTLGLAFLSWLTGSAFVALILLLFTLTLWLLARFLYRQGGLPFLHTLTVAKSAWKYLILFFVLSLPSFLSEGAPYGLILSLMGLVFAVIVHARQLAALIYLDENRTWQLTYLSLVIFAGILSSVTAMARLLTIVR